MLRVSLRRLVVRRGAPCGRRGLGCLQQRQARGGDSHTDTGGDGDTHGGADLNAHGGANRRRQHRGADGYTHGGAYADTHGGAYARRPR